MKTAHDPGENILESFTHQILPLVLEPGMLVNPLCEAGQYVGGRILPKPWPESFANDLFKLRIFPGLWHAKPIVRRPLLAS